MMTSTPRGSLAFRQPTFVVFLQSILWSMVLATSLGCASISPVVSIAPLTQPPPTVQSFPPPLHGSYYRVRAGDTLWQIARAYGLDARSLAQANHLSGTARLTVGQRLFIPLPHESQRFVWPVRGTPRKTTVTSIEIVAPNGSAVRASRSGRVAVATRDLSGLGKTVIIDHLDGYLTVYAGLEQLLVPPGAFLHQGMPVGSLGANVLRFEIRYGASPRNTLALLPQ